MTELIEKKLKEKQDNLYQIYEGLKNLQKLPKEKLDENIEHLWAVSFGLIAGIEAAMDISQFILASHGKKAESYGSLPDKMLEIKAVNKEFADKFRKMIGFRNRAIHNYPSLDSQEVYDILQNDVDDFKFFLKL
jgi:uncharacterized protein YutE (UPF0331/DUF86 family)